MLWEIKQIMTGWQGYLYWQTEDRKTLKKINQLINDIACNGNNGIGKSESLSGNLSVCKFGEEYDIDGIGLGEIKAVDNVMNIILI